MMAAETALSLCLRRAPVHVHTIPMAIIVRRQWVKLGKGRDNARTATRRKEKGTASPVWGSIQGSTVFVYSGRPNGLPSFWCSRTQVSQDKNPKQAMAPHKRRH